MKTPSIAYLAHLIVISERVRAARLVDPPDMTHVDADAQMSAARDSRRAHGFNATWGDKWKSERARGKEVAMER